MAENAQSRPSYGIDAPGLMRFFFVFGAIALAVFLVAMFSPLLGQIPKIIVSTLLGIATTYLLGMGCFMLYGSKVMKLWAVHNLEVESDREKALDEIIRVLKPNGIVVLSDIVYQLEYAKYFELHGMTNIRFHNNAIRDIILKAVTFSSFAPSAVSAYKSA